MICDTCKDIITDDVEKMLEDVEADDNDEVLTDSILFNILIHTPKPWSMHPMIKFAAQQ